MFTTGKNFIDRKNHLPLFRTYIGQNQSFMIKTPRRFGKTSIIKHLLENKTNYKSVYIDIKRVSTLKSLSNNIINEAYKISTIDNFLYKVKNSMFDLLKYIQKFKIDNIAEIAIKMYEKNDIDESEYFLHSLDILNIIAIKKNINIKFVLDKFQDISKISSNDILDKARSIMQHHNNITYIFLVRIESIMTKIFEKKSSAFFHFASSVDLPPLNVDELYIYSKKVFYKKGIKVNSLRYVLEYLSGHPDYSLQVLQKLYFISIANNIKELNEKDVYNILIDVMQSNLIKHILRNLYAKAK